MRTENALLTLRRHESNLRARGVRRAALFGSVARGENRPDSDIDITRSSPRALRESLPPLRAVIAAELARDS